MSTKKAAVQTAQNFEVKIESNIPLDRFSQRGTVPTDPYFLAMKKMSVGQSFSYPVAKQNWIAYLCDYCKKNKLDLFFQTRKVSDSHRRVWRVN